MYLFFLCGSHHHFLLFRLKKKKKKSFLLASPHYTQHHMRKPVFFPFRKRSTNLMWVRSAVKQLLGLVLVWAAVVSPGGVSDNADCLWLQWSGDDQVHSLPACLLNTRSSNVIKLDRIFIIRKGGKHDRIWNKTTADLVFQFLFRLHTPLLTLFAISPRMERKLTFLLHLWCYLYIS